MAGGNMAFELLAYQLLATCRMLELHRPAVTVVAGFDRFVQQKPAAEAGWAKPAHESEEGV